MQVLFKESSLLILPEINLITVASLQFILKSDSLGSIRELLQTSEKYGRPSSEIKIKFHEKRVLLQIQNIILKQIIPMKVRA